MGTEPQNPGTGIVEFAVGLQCWVIFFGFVFAGVIMFPLVLSVRWMWEVGNILLVSFGPCLLLTFLSYLTGIAAKSAVGIWKH